MTNAQTRVAHLRQQRQAAAGGGEKLAGKLASLIKISQALATAETLDELLDLAAPEISHRLQADQTFLLLRDGRGELHIRAEFSRDSDRPNRMAVSRSICEAVVATGEEVLVPEALEHPSFQSQESVVALNLRSVMAAPLVPVGRRQPVGVLYTCSYTTGELFGQVDLELFKALAAQIGIHLDRTRVLAEKDRLLRELETVAASRGRVVEVATHELGTPLTEVSLSLGVAQKLADVLKETGDVDAHSYELSSRLRAAARGVTGVNERFIRPLREYYDLELLLDRLAPKVLVADALEMMIKKWRRLAVDRYFEIFEELPVTLRVDPDLFDRALTELIQNAVNYSQIGDPVTVSAGRQEDWLRITVVDEGIGIPLQDLPHVDTWLYRGDNVANLSTQPTGLGIGLHTARRIIEAHGGHLTIESELGRGTQVTVALPAFSGSE